jgi:hypothetical protein
LEDVLSREANHLKAGNKNGYVMPAFPINRININNGQWRGSGVRGMEDKRSRWQIIRMSDIMNDHAYPGV